jgi:hypothetical protein
LGHGYVKAGTGSRARSGASGFPQQATARFTRCESSGALTATPRLAAKKPKMHRGDVGTGRTGRSRSGHLLSAASAVNTRSESERGSSNELRADPRRAASATPQSLLPSSLFANFAPPCGHHPVGQRKAQDAHGRSWNRQAEKRGKASARIYPCRLVSIRGCPTRGAIRKRSRKTLRLRRSDAG